MVNCAVITCKRRSVTSNLKEHGISYHTFPKNSPAREQWIKFCGQSKSWMPTKTSIICSEHFTSDSFENGSDRRKLIDNAVPTLKFFPCKGDFKNKAFITITSSPLNHSSGGAKDNEPIYDTVKQSSYSLQICRICLVTGQKLFDMQLSNLSMYYNQLTGLSMTNDEEYPQMLCWECVHRLKSWLKFRRKAMCSHDLMTEVLHVNEGVPQVWDPIMKTIKSQTQQKTSVRQSDTLTTENLSTIDRDKHKLSSVLEIQNIDIHMIESEDPELSIVQKPIIDPLSDFVYEDDDAISLTDSDEEEFLNEYKEILKLEDLEDISTDKKSLKLTRDKKKELKTEVKEEVVKCEDTEEVTLDDDNASDNNDYDNVDNQADNVDDDNRDNIVVDDDNQNDMDVKSEDGLNFDNSTNDSMDAVLSELKAEKVAGVGKKKKAKPVMMKNFRSPKKVPKKLKKERKPSNKRVPKMSRKERSELYFDKNLIEIVNIKIEDAIAMVQKRKDTENFKDADFKCFECFKGFCDKDVYDTHLEYHSLKRGEFQCHVCKVRFPKKLSVRKHLNNHLLNYCCKLCGFTTKSRIGAKRHSEYHKKGTLYKCPHCDQKFEKHTSYLGHIRKKHPSDIVCVLCGCSFVSAKGLEHHKKLKHRFDTREVKDDGPLCEDCNVRFVSEDALIMHNHKRHNENDANERNDNQPSEKENRLQDKQEKSKGRENKRDKRVPPSKPKKKIKRPLKCEQCGLELTTIRAYYWHFRKEHPDKTRTQYFLGNNKYMCEICGRFFQKADILEDHIFTHTGVKIYKCDRCGKEFNTNLSLTIHMKIHDAKRKRHACPVCGKTFLRSNNLKRHEYLHTGLRPFACDLCGKCFPTNSERKTHVEHAHFKKPWPKRNRAKENGDGRRRQMTSSASTEMVQPQWGGPGSESTADDDDAQVHKMYLYM